jgi:hypothetical protein
MVLQDRNVQKLLRLRRGALWMLTCLDSERICQIAWNIFQSWLFTVKCTAAEHFEVRAVSAEKHRCNTVIMFLLAQDRSRCIAVTNMVLAAWAQAVAESQASAAALRSRQLFRSNWVVDQLCQADASHIERHAFSMWASIFSQSKQQRETDEVKQIAAVLEDKLATSQSCEEVYAFRNDEELMAMRQSEADCSSRCAEELAASNLCEQSYACRCEALELQLSHALASTEDRSMCLQQQLSDMTHAECQLETLTANLKAEVAEIQVAADSHHQQFEISCSHTSELSACLADSRAREHTWQQESAARQVKVSELELQLWDKSAASNSTIVELEQQLASVSTTETMLSNQADELNAFLSEAHASAAEQSRKHSDKLVDMQRQADQTLRVKAAATSRLEQWRNLATRHTGRLEETLLCYCLLSWQFFVAQSSRVRNVAKAAESIHILRQEDRLRMASVDSWRSLQVCLVAWCAASSARSGHGRASRAAFRLLRIGQMARSRIGFAMWHWAVVGNRVQRCYTADLEKQSAAHSAERARHRSVVCQSALRLHSVLLCALLNHCFAHWAWAPSSARERYRINASLDRLCCKWARSSSSSLLKCTLIAWVDVLVVVHMATLRKGVIHQQTLPKSMCSKASTCRIAWKAIAMSHAAPHRMLVAVVVDQWACILRSRKVAMDLLAAVGRSQTAAIARLCWSNWRLSAGEQALLQAESASKSQRSRCLETCIKALEAAVARSQPHQQLLAAVWQAWTARLHRDGGSSVERGGIQMIDVFQARQQLLCNVASALKLQDRHCFLLLFVFGLWRWSQGYRALTSRLEHMRIGEADLRGSVALAYIHLDGGVSWMARRLTAETMREMLRSCLEAWQELLVAPCSRAFTRHCHQARRSRNLAAACADRAQHAAAESFCSWRQALREEWRDRLAVNDELCRRQRGDLQTLVELLQQSTTTCKELRVGLLEARRGSRHAAWLECFTVMRAWHSVARLASDTKRRYSGHTHA